MTDMIVEIMVEVLMILAIVTREVKRGQLSKLLCVCLPFLTERLPRKVLEEIDGEQGHRG